MTPEIKEKIEDWIVTNASMPQTEKEFYSFIREACGHSYSLAQPEIEALNREVERLNSFIELMWYNKMFTYYDHLFDEETKAYWFEIFKNEHNLLPTPPNNK